MWVGGFNKFEMFEPVRGFLVGRMPRRSILKWPWLNDLETGKWLAEAESRVDRLQICVQPRIGRIWPCSQIEIQSVEQIVFEHCNETSPSEACVCCLGNGTFVTAAVKQSTNKVVFLVSHPYLILVSLKMCLCKTNYKLDFVQLCETQIESI